MSASAPERQEVLRKGYARGYRFTPLKGKAPVRRSWQKEDPLILDELLAWAAHDNIGLRTGAISSVVVLDVDSAKGGEVPPGLPETVTVRTGGGGATFLLPSTTPRHSQELERHYRAPR